MKFLLTITAAALAVVPALAGSCTKDRAATIINSALTEAKQRGDCAGPAMEPFVNILTACTLEDVDISELQDKQDELQNICNKGGLPEGKKYAATRVVPASEASLPECTQEQLDAARVSKEQAAWNTACMSSVPDPTASAKKTCEKACLDAWAAMVAARPQCLLFGEDYRATGKQELDQVKNKCADFKPDDSASNSSSTTITTAPTSSTPSTSAPTTTTPLASSMPAPVVSTPPSSSAPALAASTVTIIALAATTAMSM